MTLRRLAAGSAMLGFVAALEVSDLVDPSDVGSTAQRLHHSSDHPGRLLAAAALLLISSALLVPTVITIHRAIAHRDRGRTLGKIATAVWIIGAIGHGAELGYYAIVASAMHHPTRQVIRVIDGTTATIVAPVIGIGIACFALGCVLMIGAMVRSGLVSRWALLAIVGGLVGQPAGEALGIRVVDVGQLAAMAPFVWLGWRSVRAAAARTDAPTAAWTTALPAAETA